MDEKQPYSVGKNAPIQTNVANPNDLSDHSDTPPSGSRRKFLGNVSGVAVAAATIGAIGLEPLPDSKYSVANAQNLDGLPGAARAAESHQIRIKAANAEHAIPIPDHPTNGDENRYPDKCGTYTKCLPHDGFGRVDLNAFQSFIAALNCGKPADFESIILGGARKLTDPQGGLAFDLEGTDSQQFAVSPAPAIASAVYGAEMVELYWASLLRDVPFTQYGSNPLAAQAAQEITGLPDYQGPRNSSNQVPPSSLFRGAFPGETVGPYISQFFIQPTSLGAQPISQQQVTYLPGIDYMTDFGSWLTVQNGGRTGLTSQPDRQLRFEHTGRDLAGWTHLDVLYQAYFVAYLVLTSMNAPTNPGCPYNDSRTQVGFATFGGPHAAGMLGEVAYRALERSWYQKWFVHRRTRPEGGGGLVHLIKTGQGSNVSCTLNDRLLNSQAVQRSFQKNGSYLLSQAFPEGSPTHPSYPTGHGVVAGACITILKFFFDGNHVIQTPMVPTDDGTQLVPYTGIDAGQITVNGELNKLGHNVSFGHGIHAGIHYRSDSDSSMILGEETALSILRDQAQTFNEKFTVHLTKLDGTTATISNQ
jgi:hypothetical protein